MPAMATTPKRPPVDVVVPFAGIPAELAAVVARLGQLRLAAGDVVVVVDNRPDGLPQPPEVAGVRVVGAPERQSSYFARNRGAAAGHNPWLLFIDADVEPPPDLVERYFEEAPVDGTGVLSGAVVDEPLELGGRQPLATRYSALKASMSQANTLGAGPWAYAQTANCAVRREAFEAVGGFRDDVRSGGDADLCFRLRQAGWEIEPRDGASVIHRSRKTLRTLLRQQARHGSGAAWLGREYPGSFPRRRWLGLAKWTAERFVHAVVARMRRRDDEAVVATVEPLAIWAFELGRLFPNEVG
jgi:GT2 family glycosyltransferase